MAAIDRTAEFTRAVAKYGEYFSRPEFKEFESKFCSFDENGNGFIDFFELKRAQEKMGNPKTHTELTSLMNEMASDPKQGISYDDFVKVQLKVKGIDPTTLAKTFHPNDLQKMFVQEITDFSVKGIKNYHEQLAQAAALEQKNADMIRKSSEAKKAEKARAEEEKKLREQEQRDKEDKLKQGKSNLAARAAMFNNNK